MYRVFKKLNTLIYLDLRWAFKFTKKHTLKWLSYFFSKLQGKTSHKTYVDGTEIILRFAHPYHHLIAKHFLKNQFEYNLLCMWQKEARKSTIIIDVGSYNGIYALIAKKANPHATVIAIEPDVVNLEHIRENAKINDVDIVILNSVVYNVVGKVQFADIKGSTGGSIGEGVEVSSVTLDALLHNEQDKKILIKLDVEGAEYDVLRGAKETLRKDVVILLEVHNEFIKKFGKTHADLRTLVHDIGYRLLWLDENPLTAHYWMVKK